MNKIRYHLHIFFKKTHSCFKSSPIICSNWIDSVIFLHFRPSKIHVSPTSVVSSLCLPWCRISSGRRHHTIASCHAFFPWSQDELAASTSFSSNALFRRLPSWAKTESLNPHHCHRPPPSDRLTPILHYYKNVISTLTTISITQPRLHFDSSLARAPCHRSSTRRRSTPIVSPHNDIHGDELADLLSLSE
jgi:hypothetical protein